VIRKELAHLAVPIKDLQTHPRNVRQGDVGAISQSLEQHGQYRPIVVQRSTGRILAGNHTYKAVKALGWKDVAATYVDCDEEQALRILLIDNRANDLATYDESALVEMLKELLATDLQLEGTGFNPDDLDDLLKITDANFTPLDDADNPRLDQKNPHRCPECGFEWREAANGTIEPV
jgi:ParB-like chromosome segregation protein Spo0J